MRAAVVHQLGGPPTLDRFPDPASDRQPADVVAAALNPVDLAIVSGQMPFRQVTPPFVAGFEGVARTAGGEHLYFSGPSGPYGSLAERVPLADAETAPVPAGLDPVVAAALGTSGLAAWLSLMTTGGLTAGENVLVLGADGQVGGIATQIARAGGAARVVGVVREESGRAGPLRRGADAAIAGDDVQTLTERLRSAAPDGIDLILDLTWGPVVAHAIEVANRGARLVQVGNAADPLATISAPAFRNRQVSFLPHSNFLLSAEERGRAYSQLAARALRGELAVETEQVALAEVGDAWERLRSGGVRRKLVIIPGAPTSG